MPLLKTLSRAPDYRSLLFIRALVLTRRGSRRKEARCLLGFSDEHRKGKDQSERRYSKRPLGERTIQSDVSCDSENIYSRISS
jgi:hypothetical protein